jgi:hypothetical protein
MHNIGVGGDFFDLKLTFLNRPISKLKHIKICLWQIIWDNCYDNELEMNNNE